MYSRFAQHLYDPKFLWHDYTYLPFALLPSAAARMLGADPRWIFGLLQLALGLVFLRCRGIWRHAGLTSVFVSQLFYITSSVPFLLNTIFAPLAILVMGAAYCLRRYCRLSATLLAASLLILQSNVLALPAVGLAFLWSGAWRVLPLAAVLIAAVMLPLTLADPEAFSASVLRAHLIPEISAGLPVVNVLMRLAATIASAFVLYEALKKRRDIDDALVVRCGAASLVLLFMLIPHLRSERYWIVPAVLLLYRPATPGIAAMVRDKLLSRSRYGGDIALCMLAIFAAGFFAATRSSVDRGLLFAIGESKRFTFAVPHDGEAGLCACAVDAPYPDQPFSFSRSYGWLNTQYFSQFWVMTPPGKYDVALCGADDGCDNLEVRIDRQESFGLRIPLLFRRNASGSIDGAILHNGYVAPTEPLLGFRQVERFSVTRLE